MGHSGTACLQHRLKDMGHAGGGQNQSARVMKRSVFKEQTPSGVKQALALRIASNGRNWSPRGHLVFYHLGCHFCRR